MASVLDLPIDDLPEGMEAVEALVVARVLLPEGHPAGPYALVALTTEGLFPWDVVGMARYAQLTAEQQIMEGTEE